MAEQAREMEFVLLGAFVVVIMICGLLWQYRFDVQKVSQDQAAYSVKANIFELLMSKERGR